MDTSTWKTNLTDKCYYVVSSFANGCSKFIAFYQVQKHQEAHVNYELTSLRIESFCPDSSNYLLLFDYYTKLSNVVLKTSLQSLRSLKNSNSLPATCEMFYQEFLEEFFFFFCFVLFSRTIVLSLIKCLVQDDKTYSEQSLAVQQ